MINNLVDYDDVDELDAMIILVDLIATSWHLELKIEFGKGPQAAEKIDLKVQDYPKRLHRFQIRRRFAQCRTTER